MRRYEGYLQRLIWLGDDIEEKTFDWNTERASYEDVLLAASKNTVTRWPGRGDVTIEGLWINGSSELEHIIDQATPLSIRLAVLCHRSRPYALRYVITFWSSMGKRVGIAENDCDQVDLVEGDVHEVSVEISAGVFGSGVYYIALTIFGLGSSGSSAIEKDSRQDMVYKSVRLEVNDGDSYLPINPPPGTVARFFVPLECEVIK